MKTLKPAAFALALAAGLAGPALAANTTPPANKDQTGAADQASLRDQVRNDLTKDGFTDVKVMPQSFLVRAKDPKGNPVMMVINPDSFTEVTTISPNSPNNTNSSSDKMTGGAPNVPTPPAK